MRLYVMRHAIAAPHAATEARDAERPLTEEGHRQAQDVAAGLKWLEIPLDAIAASPYRRAAQTAEEVRRVLAPELACREVPALQPQAAPPETIQALRLFANCSHVLIVGHEPNLSRSLGVLIGEGGSGAQVSLKKGSVTCVEVARLQPGGGTLKWLLTPKQLRLIGRGGAEGPGR